MASEEAKAAAGFFSAATLDTASGLCQNPAAEAVLRAGATARIPRLMGFCGARSGDAINRIGRSLKEESLLWIENRVW
jgi:hypothetical protein